jgi:uncharacterized membrane protein
MLNPLMLYALVCGLMPGLSAPGEDRGDDRGRFSTASIVAVLVSVLTLIITAFLLSGVAEPFFNATENVTTAVQNATTGNETIDNLMGPFGILVAAVMTIAFIQKILDAT